MFKAIFSILMLLFCSCASAQSIKMQNLTEDTNPTTDDLLMSTDAPATTAGTRKVTFGNLYKKIPVSGILLQNTAGTLSVKEGTLTDSKYCTYSTASGLVCSSNGGSTECSTSSCNLNSATTLNSKSICLSDGTNCSTPIGALIYKGTLDASGAAYPTPAAQGDYYIINVSGTIDAVLYSIGDWAVYNGSSWDKIDNTATTTSPGGSDTYVQYNNGGNFGGSSGFTYSGGVVTATTFSGALSGNATTATAATALSANGANCTAGSYPLGVDASGAVEGCTDATTEIDSAIATHEALTSVHGATSSNTVSRIVARDASGNFSAGTITAALTGNASTATALNANPGDCVGGQYATAIDASGNLTCSTPATGALSGLTTNYVPKATNSTTIANGTIYDNGNIGIGNASPSTKLHVTGTVTATAFAGPLTGNASTASALAANGSNCSAGSYPLGVDAAGAAENCTVVTAAADLSNLDQGIYFDTADTYDIGTALVGIHDIHVDGAIYSYSAGISEFASDITVDGDIYATTFYGSATGLTDLPSSSQWTTSGSNIYYSAGNVGIASATAPRGALDIIGSTKDLIVDGSVYEGYAGVAYADLPTVQHSIKAMANSATKPIFAIYNDAGQQNFQVYSTTGGDGEMRFRDDTSTTRVDFNAGSDSFITSQSSTGSLGVATTTVNATLDVGGFTNTHSMGKGASNGDVGIKGDLEVDGQIYMDGTGVLAGRAVCWASTGRLGYCSTAVGIGGDCTCN